MPKKYIAEFRTEAVKLSQEIGTRATAERLDINCDTRYTWISKTKQNKTP